MSDERKPVWPWIVTLLIGLPVLYVLSYGPWISCQYALPLPSFEVVDAGNSFFAPLEQMAMNGPDWLMDPYRSYLSWCSEMANGPELTY